MKEKKIDRDEAGRVRKTLDDAVTDEKFLDALAQAAADPEARKRLVKGAGPVNVEPLDEPGSWGVRVSLKGKGASSSVVFRATRNEAPASAPAADREQFKRAYRELSDALSAGAVLDTVEAAVADEAEHAKLKADPEAVLKAKGVRLPKGAAVSIVEHDAARAEEQQQEGVYYREVCYQVCEGWWIFQWCRTECYWLLMYS